MYSGFILDVVWMCMDVLWTYGCIPSGNRAGLGGNPWKSPINGYLNGTSSITGRFSSKLCLITKRYPKLSKHVYGYYKF